MNDVHFMTVNPSYNFQAFFPEPPEGGAAIAARSEHIYLTNLTDKEVKVFTDYFIRVGATVINVERIVPFSFRQELSGS